MAKLIKWEPLREMMGMRHAMDRLFDDFYSYAPATYEGYGVVDLDMYQTDNDIVIKVAVPGVKPEDLKISVTGDVLTIRGEVKVDEEVKEANYHIRERRYGSFSRSVALPGKVVADKAVAEFKNGVLNLTLPKAEEIKPKTITVKAK
ncbi:MAG TPA: Hsp20/alpha crystallin family protein [Anaerolineae bacterium]|nr:Hsp20/alpha crystallin family protein [Anaerolineae bacterium]